MVAEACMDDKKADGVRSPTLLTPTPPDLTGSDALAQASASSLRLPREVSAFLITSSGLVVSEEAKQGAECSIFHQDLPQKYVKKSNKTINKIQISQ